LPKIPYTIEQYLAYEEVALENSHIDHIQVNHYRDEGCVCKACSIKRVEIAIKIVKGIPVNERIIHTEAKTELIKKTVGRATRINNAIKQMPRRGTRLNNEMQRMVGGKRF
jgi:hypothetical protein